MPASVITTRRLGKPAAAAVLCALVAVAAPCLAQGEPGVDSGPSVAAFEVLLGELRAAAASGAVAAAAAESAEELWVEQQADLIRSDAELRILALRAGQECPPVEEVVRLVVEREQRAFERLERLRALVHAESATVEVPGSGAVPAGAEAEGTVLGLRITSEPEDLTEDPTP